MRKKNSGAQNQPVRARASLPASMSEPAASAATAMSWAWRTKLCRYWAENKCLKGDRCAFAHVDDQGKDWHAPVAKRPVQSGAQELPKRNAESVAESEAPGSSASTSVKRSKLQLPGEQHEDVKQHARADASSEAQGSTHSQDGVETALFGWPSEDTGLIHKWLHEERSVPDQKCDLFERHAVQLITSNGQTVYRCPYEEYHYDTAPGECKKWFKIAGNMDVVWCTMLYGRGERLQQHLANALILGADLRKKVRPAMMRRGLTFANVIFLTDDALQEYEVKAISWFWSVVRVSLPKVNSDRLESVSKHLLGDAVDPAHVFLKVEAFKMNATISIISDLDMLVLNAERLVEFLLGFVTDKSLKQRMEDCGNVAVMHRIDSRVDFDAPMRAREGVWQPHQGPRSVSYCVAVIKPSEELTEKYMQMMAAGARRSKGTLSDQDLLGEVLASRYLELNHDVIMFPSWFNHANINHRRAVEILKTMEWESFDELQSEEIDHFIDRFGAVHFSASFSPIYDKSEDDKKRDLYNMGGQKSHLGKHNGATISNDAYIDNFLMPLWYKLRKLYESRRSELSTSIAQTVGSTNPTPGLSRAMVTLANRAILALPKRRPKRNDGTERRRQTQQSAPHGAHAKSVAPKPPARPLPPWKERSSSRW